jgi:hypothetical protein
MVASRRTSVRSFPQQVASAAVAVDVAAVVKVAAKAAVATVVVADAVAVRAVVAKAAVVTSIVLPTAELQHKRSTQH